MNLHTTAAIRTAAAFDYDSAYDRAHDQILDALLDGGEVKCGQFTASLSDAAEHAFTRKDADAHFAALVTGQISADDFKAWALRQLSDYADTLSTDKADEMLADAIDFAEYSQEDR